MSQTFDISAFDKKGYRLYFVLKNHKNKSKSIIVMFFSKSH